MYGNSPGIGGKGDTQIKVINGYSTNIGLLKVQGIGSSKPKRQNFFNSQISKSAGIQCLNLMLILTLIGVISSKERTASRNKHHGFKLNFHFSFKAA